MGMVVERGPVTAADEEKQALSELERQLACQTEQDVALVGLTDKPLTLPPSARRVLQEALPALARGHAVTIVRFQKDLTTQQAADLLDVSRPYLVRLLDEGTIPSTKTGTHRRVHLDDVLAYRDRRDAERREALAELTRLSQEMELYSMEPYRDPDEEHRAGV
jgi:excisionase family DNA binding protein